MNAPDLTRSTAPAVDADLSAMMDAVFADYRAGTAERVPGRRETLDRALWRRLDDLGLVRLTGAEAAGGSGAGWREATELLSAAVRHGVRVPLAEHDLLASWLWEAVTGDSGDDCVRTVCVLDGNGYAETPVPWAGEADRVVVVWPSGPEYRVADLQTAALAISPATNLIGEPRDVVVVDTTPHSGHPASPALVTQLKQKAALIRAIQVCAAMDRAVQMAVEHASTRIQFGRPLAKFQAIQNLVSDAAAHAALARSATEAALNIAIESGWESLHLAFNIAVARSCAGHAASVVTRNSHQVHGAIGTTHEHRLPEYTRAALAWRSEFGTVHFWDGQVAAAAMSAGQKGLWELIAAGS